MTVLFWVDFTSRTTWVELYAEPMELPNHITYGTLYTVAFPWVKTGSNTWSNLCNAVLALQPRSGWLHRRWI
jgi:hypothetical protein